MLNKIDLPSAQPEKYAAELAHIIGCDPDDVLRVSAKTGEGVEELLNAIVDAGPAARRRRRRAAARADLRLGLRHLPRRDHLRPGRSTASLTHRDRIKMMSTGAVHEMLEVGVISPEPDQGCRRSASARSATSSPA